MKHLFQNRRNAVGAKKQNNVFEAFNQDELEQQIRMCLDDIMQSYYYDVLDAKLDNNNKFEISFTRMPKPLLSTISQTNDMWNEGGLAGDNIDLEVNDTECLSVAFDDDRLLTFVENTAYWRIDYEIDFERGRIHIYGKLDEDFLQKKVLTVGDRTGLK